MEQVSHNDDAISAAAPETVQTEKDHAVISATESRPNINNATGIGGCFRPLIGLFVGLLAAVAHHLFYSYLSNREIQGVSISQAWVIRFGNAIAFFFKMALATAVGAAYTQGFWFFVRRKNIKIVTLDVMFGLLSNPTSFLSFDLPRKMTLLFALGVVAWILPITAVLVPGSLTVSTVPRTTEILARVPVLDPTHMRNDTTLTDELVAVIRTSTLVLSSGNIVPWASPCGVNCTYNMSFSGPAYECADLGPLDSVPVDFLALHEEGWNNNSVLPPFINASLLWWGLDDSGNGSSPVKFWAIYGGLNHTIRCILYNATYNATVTYTNNIQTVETVVNRNEIITNGYELWLGLGDPQDLLLYSLHESVLSVLSGWMALQSPGINSCTDVINWAGVASFSNATTLSFPNNMPTLLEELMTNLTLSTIVLRDESDPAISNLIDQVTVPALVTTYPAIYVYSRVVLWQIYGTAMAVSVVCLAIGAYMLYRNGAFRDLRFSDVLVATRNPTLDEITNGAFKETPLKYGVLDGTDRMCFGTPSEIMSGSD